MQKTQKTENQIKINFRVTKAQEKQFLRVYFDVPKDVESITVSYNYKGDSANSMPSGEKNVIDLALLDNEGNEVGASGSMARSVIVSESYSSPGYKRLAVKQGKWCIICGAYLVKEAELDIFYTIDFKMKAYRYIKGDLHMHTINSDGRLTVLELAKMASKLGLDFIMTSDHNNFAHNKHLPEIQNLTIIPGVELTHYNGHMNIWGASVPYTKTYAVNDFDQFKELVCEAHQNNTVISLNHPFCSFCPWRWEFADFHYDAVEVWNGPMRQDNLKAIEWWHSELCKGRKLTAVGGSDYHKNYFGIFNFFSNPTTRVYSKSKSQADILDAIKGGRCAVTTRPNSSMIYLTSGETVVGDTAKLQNDTTVKIRVDKLKQNHILVVYNQNGEIFSHKAKSSASYEIELPIKEKGFVRAEIKCKAKGFPWIVDKGVTYLSNKKDIFKKLPYFVYALTNPIYFE